MRFGSTRSSKAGSDGLEPPQTSRPLSVFKTPYHSFGTALGAHRGIRTPIQVVLSHPALPVGVRRSGAHPETRTRNLLVLSESPLPIGLDGLAGVRSRAMLPSLGNLRQRPRTLSGPYFEHTCSRDAQHIPLGTDERIRTSTARVLSAMPPAVGLRQHGREEWDSNPRAGQARRWFSKPVPSTARSSSPGGEPGSRTLIFALQERCSPVELVPLARYLQHASGTGAQDSCVQPKLVGSNPSATSVSQV